MIFKDPKAPHLEPWKLKTDLFLGPIFDTQKTLSKISSQIPFWLPKWPPKRPTNQKKCSNNDLEIELCFLIDFCTNWAHQMDVPNPYNDEKTIVFTVWQRKPVFLIWSNFLIDFGLNFDPFGYHFGCKMDQKSIQRATWKPSCFPTRFLMDFELFLNPKGYFFHAGDLLFSPFFAPFAPLPFSGPFLRHFGPIWTILAPFWTHLTHFGYHFGTILDNVGLIWLIFGLLSGPLWTIWGSFVWIMLRFLHLETQAHV